MYFKDDLTLASAISMKTSSVGLPHHMCHQTGYIIVVGFGVYALITQLTAVRHSANQPTPQVGPGFAIAAALFCRDHHPGKRVICVEGDSAFGFSGMEIETMVRYNLPIVIVIVNNGGIYSGFDQATFDALRSSGDDVTRTTPPSALSVGVRYEQLMGMFGQQGHLVRTVPELRRALADSLANTGGPSMVNVLISPSSDRKPQTFSWLTESKL